MWYGLVKLSKIHNQLLIWGYELSRAQESPGEPRRAQESPGEAQGSPPKRSGEPISKVQNSNFALGVRSGQKLKTSKLNFALGVRTQEGPGQPRRVQESAGEPGGTGELAEPRRRGAQIAADSYR